MRSETSLLQLLIGYWDSDCLLFMVDDEPLPLEVEDIYFLTGLSRRGREANLRGGGRGEAALTIQEYITVYCEEGTQKVASQIPIARIRGIGLRSVAYCFGEDVGHCCPTRDFMTVDVLCFGVHATDYIRLVHQFTCIYPHAADSVQDRQVEEFWLW